MYLQIVSPFQKSLQRLCYNKSVTVVCTCFLTLSILSCLTIPVKEKKSYIEVKFSSEIINENYNMSIINDLYFIFSFSHKRLLS